jgi:hypothetical protein
MLATFLIAPQPPQAGAGHPPGLRSIVAGLGYLRGRPVIQGAYLLDINAMVFGMPRAVFPALASTVFGGGARTLGFLYAAPGAGALLGAVTTGWVHRVRRQGRTVIAAVLVWGAAITCFGLVRWLPAALVLLAVAGCADVISAVFRGTILQLMVPDRFRGRLMGVQMAVVTGGPRVGDAETGAVAAAFGPVTSVVSGGLACVAGALILARLLPAFRRQEAPDAVLAHRSSGHSWKGEPVAWKTGWPPATVARTRISVIRSGSVSSGLRSRITKSASLPGRSEPRSCSRRMANAASVVYRASASRTASRSPGPSTRPLPVRRSTASRIPTSGSAVITGASEDPATRIPARRHDAYAYSSSLRSGSAAANPSPRMDSIPGWAATTMPSEAARAASGANIDPPCSIRCRSGLPGRPRRTVA